MYNTNRLH